MLVLSTIVKLVALLSYLVLALLTLRSRAERGVRIFFSTYLLAILCLQLTSLIVNFTKAAQTALVLYNLLLACSGTINAFFFLFSRSFLNIKRQRALVILSYASCAVILAGGFLGLQFQEVEFGRSGYFVPVFNNPRVFVIIAGSYFFWLCGIYNLVRAFVREKSPVQRNRIIYVLLGASVIVIGLSSNLTGLRDYPVDISFNLVSALIIGYAVVRHRLLDIRFFLARSLFYSILTLALVAVYLGVVFVMESVLKQSIGYTGQAYGIIVILILGLIFLPLRNLLQNALDKIFFREKSDYQKATQSFSRDVTHLYDTERILDLVGNAVAETVKPVGLSIALLDERRNAFTVRKSAGSAPGPSTDLGIGEQSTLARWLSKEGKPLVREEALMDPCARPILEDNHHLFEGADISLVVPVLLKDKLMGTLIMGPKLAGTMYNNEDLRFLNTIANQTATAIEKSIIFREMERRLSEQTLMFILSERFRSSADFDSVMTSIVQILKSFLTCDACALVSFEKGGSFKKYSLDAVSEAAAGVACELHLQLTAESKSPGEVLPIPMEDINRILANRPDIDAGVKSLISSLVFLPLRGGRDTLGMLILPNRTGSQNVDAHELELLRTIRAIISQGILLYKTIVNLVSVKTYNENILGSLNDMGDTLVILDLGGTIKSVNRATCRRLGYREEELVGRHMREVVGRGEVLFTEEGIVGLLAAGSVANYEMKYRTKEGTEVPMLFSGSVMTGEDGKTREIVGIARKEMSKNKR
jgi:PAS domain S-box-containing protein